MNHRDSALAAMQWKKVDHIPFIARMDLWYSYHHTRGTLPHPYENASLWDMQRDMGIGIFGFGAWDISFYRLVHKDVEITVEEKDGITITRCVTPHGTLTSVDRMSEELKEAAGTGARMEFPFRDANDYDALQFLIEHTEVVDNNEEYGRFVDSIGTDGVALPFSAHLPAHQLMLKYMGYEKFYLEMFENEDKLERLIQALTDQYYRALEIGLNCSAKAIEVGGNYDEQMTPPPMFEKYFSPVYRKTREMFAAEEKIMVIHGDGEMKRLLQCIMDCGIQVVEALTPKPMTSIDLVQVRDLWMNKVAIWGGIPSIILTEAFTEEEFESHLEGLFKTMAADSGFILGFGDNVPTDALFPRIVRTAEYWREHGKL
jgi:hypothetical protein